MRYQVLISETEERHTLVKQLMEEQLLEKQLILERLTEQINQLKKENMQLKQRIIKIMLKPCDDLCLNMMSRYDNMMLEYDLTVR